MKSCFWMLLFFFTYSAHAQIHFKSFKEVLNYADHHAIAIQSAKIGEQIAMSEKKEARSYLLPTVNASLGYNDNITLQPTLVPAQLVNPSAPEGAFEELTFGTRYLYSRGLHAQWDLLNFQKMFAAQTADLQAKESKINTGINKFNTYNQLASTYYSLLLTEESIDIYEENVRVSTSIFEHANGKFQKGIISEAELNRAEIKMLQNQRSLDQAKNNLEQLYVQLQSQLNTEQLIGIHDKLDNFVLDEREISLVHPEVLLQEAHVKTQESILKQTKALRIPSLSLAYQYNQNWATNNFMDFESANKLPQQAFGVQIDLSGLLNSSTRQKVKQSKRQLELQQIQLANTELVKQQEDELLQLQWTQASDQLARNKKIWTLQQENDVHAENQYLSGIMSLDMRLDIYDDLLGVQDMYLQSLASFTLAQYKIFIRQLDFQSHEY